jgi:UDP-glucose 4-epimerase
MQRALVTGGAGFIGSHLVDRLQKDGYDVLVIDNSISGEFNNIKANTRIIRSDLSKCENESFPDFDILFHIAAYPIRRDKLFDYKIYLEQTEGGTLAALEIARKNDIPLFVMPASTTIYGQAKIIPTPEDFIGPDMSFYGTSKFNSERWCEAYAGLFGISVLITRFGRILGPRARNGSVWELINRLKGNPDKLEVLGDGTQTRSFLHVEDCIEGMMTSLKNRKGIVDRFNIANNDTATVKDMVEIILEETRLHPRVSYGIEPIGWKGDNELVFPDVSKLRSFGWRPKRNSKETIRECVQWTLKEVFHN